MIESQVFVSIMKEQIKIILLEKIRLIKAHQKQLTINAMTME